MSLGIALSLLTYLAQSSGTAGKSYKHEISQQEAETLVYKAIEGKPNSRLPGFGLDNVSMLNFPQFYFFEGVWNNPKPGSGLSGFWAVDARTGDVWDPYSCKLMSSPSLKSELARIRRRKNISSKVLQQARAQKPCL